MSLSTEAHQTPWWATTEGCDGSRQRMSSGHCECEGKQGNLVVDEQIHQPVYPVYFVVSMRYLVIFLKTGSTLIDSVYCHAHLAVGRQKAMVGGGTRMSVKMGRYPTGRGGALCSSRSSTAPLMSLDTSPRMSSSTDTCSSLTGQKKKQDRVIILSTKHL